MSVRFNKLNVQLDKPLIETHALFLSLLKMNRSQTWRRTELKTTTKNQLHLSRTVRVFDLEDSRWFYELS